MLQRRFDAQAQKPNLNILLLEWTLNQGRKMRIDKFLNSVNITKRRAVSEDMCKNGVVSINGVIAKPAKDVKVGDIITVAYLERSVRYEVVQLPQTKTIPKTQQNDYVREIK